MHGVAVAGGWVGGGYLGVCFEGLVCLPACLLELWRELYFSL